MEEDTQLLLPCVRLPSTPIHKKANFLRPPALRSTKEKAQKFAKEKAKLWLYPIHL